MSKKTKWRKGQRVRYAYLSAPGVWSVGTGVVVDYAGEEITRVGNITLRAETGYPRGSEFRIRDTHVSSMRDNPLDTLKAA